MATNDQTKTAATKTQTAAQTRAAEKALKAEQAKRAKLAAVIAKDREAGMTGAQLREKHGDWLTGPARRKLLREHGHDGLIAASYNRADAKARREAEAQAQASKDKAAAKV